MFTDFVGAGAVGEHAEACSVFEQLQMGLFVAFGIIFCR
jgi:hypothetical protein